MVCESALQEWVSFTAKDQSSMCYAEMGIPLNIDGACSAVRNVNATAYLVRNVRLRPHLRRRQFVCVRG